MVRISRPAIGAARNMVSPETSMVVPTWPGEKPRTWARYSGRTKVPEERLMPETKFITVPSAKLRSVKGASETMGWR